ncbi:MAG: chromosomal replication initiator protein DnaA [Actinomycetia bacterium]|nr:chromosomal replication initiator protein DnaA [Actinomycetes bacterium]
MAEQSGSPNGKNGEADLDSVWKSCLGLIRAEIPTPYIASMIDPLRLISLEKDTCTVSVPNSFLKEIIAERYIGHLTDSLSRVTGRSINVLLTVLSSPSVVESIATRVPRLDEMPPNEGNGGESAPPERKTYTFENFIVGDSNKFAYSAALMVAEFPGHNYNPLFIYGGTGLGKTHLLYAIQAYATAMNPGTKVTYVQTSKFIDEFIATITLKRDKEIFDQKYINNRIVLFDDIQALSTTDATQNKFFDIFNVLYSANSHIVLSSDRPPVEIPQLSDRIRSRFEGGLMIDIMPPDLETRMAILGMKANVEGIEIPDDSLMFIASKVKDNIRTLEGLFHRVVAYAQLYGTKIDLPMVQDVLKDQVAEPFQSKAPTVELIQNTVSSYYSIPRDDLASKSRSRPLVQGRQVAMYLCRELTDETLLAIGKQFGNRDHATVIHSCRKVESLIKLKRDMFQEVTQITNIINKSL